MYAVSDDFLEAVAANTRNYYWADTITTAAGKVYEFGYGDILKGSGYISSQRCGSTEIELGTHNTTASAGRSIKYIVIHYTAGVSSVKGKAANTAEYFASTANQTSADFIVDDETIVQYNPDLENRYCWHCGGSELSTKGGSLHGVAKNLDLYAGW